MKYLKKNGYTIIEILIVLGLIAIFTASMFYIVPKVQTNSRINEETENIITITKGLKDAFQERGEFSTLGNTNNAKFLIDSKIIPPKMIVDNNNLINSFGGSVFINAATNNNYFILQYNGLPRAACVKLSSGIGNQFSKVSVNGTAPANDLKAFNQNIVITPDMAVALCDNDTNQVMFYGTANTD